MVKHKHSATTITLDLTGQQRMGKTEVTFRIGIQKENKSAKSTTLKVA